MEPEEPLHGGVNLIPVDHNPFSALASAAGARPVLNIDPMASGNLAFIGPRPGEPANVNTSQAEIRESLPGPLSLFERNWQNYGSRMTPDEVMGSEPVWGAAQQYADQGLGRSQGFAAAANDMWQRMGANRYITPEMAQRYMNVEEAKQRGIKLIPVDHDPFE